MTHKIPIDKITEKIREKNPELVSIQMPEGLKRKAQKISNTIETKTDTHVLISGDPCYGACDLEDWELKKLGVDLIIHLGHSEIPLNTEIDVVYFDIPMEIEIDRLIEKAIDKIGSGDIGLITTVQHHHLLPEIKKKLPKQKINPVIGEGDKAIANPGQVLGCNFSATEIDVDKYLFIGTGNFHPTGIAYSTNKPVIIIDPERQEIREIENTDLFIKKRYATIAKAQKASSFGVILSTKTGQTRKKLALKIKERLKKEGYKASVVTMEEVSPNRLLQLGYDAYINTGCPRITYDDHKKYKQPILTPTEHEILVGDRDWSNLEFDEIRRQ
ncbi:diphthamide biosynthesis enzyme Dph2 [Methanonatronarchaeum sp. AMET-Sl]|uniref:diphthamide biosynthesis enzyme Dph2 n=1 Tax=Methanonatronarchaeum sp. AMET-Sl TaxID=3037654 RepID=UPI00244DEC6A|nr:diphthamide biosynthesis enzyme Dph2 [Methanonatronarchaeum sp. AMET-Sl]WGI17778.1 diphthamide biosynthesis enzyme Dph2 [Methanonatronarchaeum sp. AMET-Sl]